MSRIASMRHRQGVLFGGAGSIAGAPNDLAAERAEVLPSDPSSAYGQGLLSQAHIAPAPAAVQNAPDDASVDTYIGAISAALNTSWEQTLTIIANLDFMDAVAK